MISEQTRTLAPELEAIANSGPPAPAASKPGATTGGAEAGAPSPAATLQQRLADARVDLLAHIDGGVPERAWLPRSDRMLARGGRHHVAAPLKSGKSLGFLAHAVDMVIADARVVILDRENGADEYARRLRDILTARPASARDAIQERLAYYAWPVIRLTDGQGLAAAISQPDLVILDSTRTFLSGFQLDEDSSDDFAKFAGAIVDPLFRAGIATVQLDNTGHGDTARARGSSSKGDLADVLYTLKTTAAFDEQRRGRLQLKRTHSRFGDVAPAFVMELGAGHFGAFTADPPDGNASPDTFRPTFLMERVCRTLEEHPGLSKRAVRETVKGNNDALELALELLVADGHIEVRREGKAHLHHVVRPYREDDEDPDRAPVPKPCPNRAPGTVEDHRAPVPTPLGHGARGTVDPGTEHSVTVPEEMDW